MRLEKEPLVHLPDGVVPLIIRTTVTKAVLTCPSYRDAAKHPILTGVDKSFHVKSWLYKVLPDYPAKGSTWLLMGKSVNPESTDAIDNPVAWTWQNAAGGKTFMTTMGHPEDFQQESVQRLAINAIHWTLGLPVPKKWAGKIDINVPYRGM